MIHKPYLLFLGDAPDQLAAKVAKGICDWRPEHVVGQFRMKKCNADLGVADLSLAEAKAAGAKTMVLGVANRGGIISDSWKTVLRDAMSMGFDLASGLHSFLNDDPELVAHAVKHGRTMHDVRKPNTRYPIANGRQRSGKRCLAVGTDVSIGKMYTTLAMQKEMSSRGLKSTFRATGQTGILIEGRGVPVDAVVADFMSGSVEWLTPDNDRDHWDFIEGQGSLFHASYSGISLALLHGGQPDALLLCHDLARSQMRGLDGFAPPTLEALRDTALSLARVVNSSCAVAGIAINSSSVGEDEARNRMAEIEDRLELPTVDPFRQGAGRLVDSLLAL